LTFNLFSLIMIGGVLTCFTSTLNKFLVAGALEIKTGIENNISLNNENQSLIPLFIINKLKSKKLYYFLC
jgi:hypothetical protein